MIFRKYTEILEEKEEIARKKLEKAKPAIAVSLKEGILLLAANSNLKFDKIYQLYDRIACIISGARADFTPALETLIFAIENWANFYSEGDIVLEKIAEGFAGLLKMGFENPNVIIPYTVNIALVEVAPTQKDDILIRIDFKGDLKDFDSYLVLGNKSKELDLEEATKKALKENDSIEKTFSTIAEIDKKLRQVNKGRLEAVFLDRKRVVKKEFEDVFQRRK